MAAARRLRAPPHRAGLRPGDRRRAPAGIRRDRPDAVLDLLAISFEPTDAPAGIVTLVFAGGGAIRLEVECIEARLADLGAAWATAAKPEHDLVASIPSPPPDRRARRGAVAIRLDQSDPDFEARFAALLAAKREVAEDVDAAARAIIDDVRQRGDAALIDYTAQFDRLT